MRHMTVKTDAELRDLWPHHDLGTARELQTNLEMAYAATETLNLDMLFLYVRAKYIRQLIDEEGKSISEAAHITGCDPVQTELIYADATNTDPQNGLNAFIIPNKYPT
jgi:hypothetical protein